MVRNHYFSSFFLLSYGIHEFYLNSAILNYFLFCFIFLFFNIILTLPSLGIEPGEDEDGEDAVHDKINQDRGCVVYPYRSSEDEALFMVLDGHGEQGDRISEFVMRQVHTYNKCLSE